MGVLIADEDGAKAPTYAYIFVALMSVRLLYVWILQPRRTSFPYLNAARTPWSYVAAKRDYISNARKLLAEGARKFSGPWNLVTDSGTVVMLPADMIDAVNAEDALSFSAFVREENLSNFETFRTMRSPPPGMFNEAVMKGITRALPKFTKPISLEMSDCLDQCWGDVQEWKEISINKEILAWVGRLSTRIFLPEKFCRNEKWLKVSTAFTVNLFTAMAVTKLFHPVLRPLVDLVSPLNRRVRSEYRVAKAILEPEFDKREKEIAAAAKESRNPILPDDSIEWFRKAANGRSYQQVDIQLGLAIAAIHTTSDLLSQAVLNLCAYPQYVEPLRREAADVLGKYGLQKLSLTELRLLDSFLKETQRLKPLSIASMHRSATADVELPGGYKIRKGEHTAISSSRMWDEAEYNDAEQFDAYRFVNRRQIPGYENKSLLVATSPDHLGFSHGKHACPGRFFAANEVKIALLHMLLKYDMQIADVRQAAPVPYGVNMIVNSKAKIQIKKRKPEVDLEQLALSLE